MGPTGSGKKGDGGMEGDLEVQLSFVQVLLSCVPILCATLVAYLMDLSMTNMFVIGTVRTLVQLTVVGMILSTVFQVGEEHASLVIAYVAFMIIVASFEAMGRQKYRFTGIYLLIFGTITVSLVSVTAFGFGVILHPVPVWDPRYVIPISGMLLGNTVSAVSLSLNTFVTNMMERREELDLMLSFGANKYEAALPFIRTAVTTGLTPTLNSMAVIGLVSLPGMMTGQILGGTPPVQATRYQVMIMYFIASCSFVCVLLTVFLTTRIAFDGAHIFRKDRFHKRVGVKRDVFVRLVLWFFNIFVGIYRSMCARKDGYTEVMPSEKDSVDGFPEQTNGSKQRFSVIKVNKQSSTNEILGVQGVKRSVQIQETGQQVTLFEGVNAKLFRGDLGLVKGQSGSGKTQFLRLIAGLDPLEAGNLYLQGRVRIDGKNMTQWRQQVRYVTQTRITISGTPVDFILRICSFQANHGKLSAPRLQLKTRQLISLLGMSEDKMNQDWKDLSGGEAQRMIVAIGLSSDPMCLLLDEPDSALDHKTKLILEQAVKETIRSFNIAALWITHDEEQFKRLNL